MTYHSTLSWMTKPFRFLRLFGLLWQFLHQPRHYWRFERAGDGFDWNHKKQGREYLMRFRHLPKHWVAPEEQATTYTNLFKWYVWLLVRQKLSQSCPTAILGMKIAQQQDTWRINRSERYSQVLVALPAATTIRWEKLIHLTNSLVTVVLSIKQRDTGRHFPHLLEVKWLLMKKGCKLVTESKFRVAVIYANTEFAMKARHIVAVGMA